MAIYMDGKAHFIGALTEPSSYDADLTPVDMQHGRTAYVQGKKITGTGKCFEHAEYGYSRVSEVEDENGDVKYGLNITINPESNILILSPMLGGDVIVQTNFFLDEGVTKVGENITAGGNVYAYYNGKHIVVYLESISSAKTKLLYFLGKDNEI